MIDNNIYELYNKYNHILEVKYNYILEACAPPKLWCAWFKPIGDNSTQTSSRHKYPSHSRTNSVILKYELSAEANSTNALQSAELVLNCQPDIIRADLRLALCAFPCLSTSALPAQIIPVWMS